MCHSQGHPHPKVSMREGNEPPTAPFTGTGGEAAQLNANVLREDAKISQEKKCLAMVFLWHRDCLCDCQGAGWRWMSRSASTAWVAT